MIWVFPLLVILGQKKAKNRHFEWHKLQNTNYKVSDCDLQASGDFQLLRIEKQYHNAFTHKKDVGLTSFFLQDMVQDIKKTLWQLFKDFQKINHIVTFLWQ